jgi:UDPglucose--hexose-1-phosphate uridylyltransferase
MSVIRLRSSDKERLCSLAACILQNWRGYSDESADILAFTDGTPHNTITPICRMRDGQFELDLVLRNNRTTEDHPLGIFHPHAEYHHIKKENIGLIEVMGLAILPARLKTELKQLAFYLQHPEKEDELTADSKLLPHLDWYKSLKARGISTEEEIRQDIGKIFAEILGNAGVYKDTESGKEAFLRFVKSVNCPQGNK